MATSSSSSSAKTQIINTLKADHKKVKNAFKDFEKLDSGEQAESAVALVQQTLMDIVLHATLEEEVFYPGAREAIKEEDLIDEAEVEHMTVKVLIEQLKGMSASDEKFAATFKVLGEYIDHHVQEEENEMFKQLTRPGVDWDAILDEMQTRRAQLLKEKGMSTEEEAPEGVARKGTTRKTSGTSESRPRASQSPKFSSSEKK
jgi:hemerythrin-like domain-containing protein